MIIVDLNNEKTIKFYVPSISSIKNVIMVIKFPNDVEKKYPGTINIPTEEVSVHLPILKDFITDKLETEYYLEFEDFHERFFRHKTETILFQFSPIIKLNFHEIPKPDISAELLNQETINEKNTVKKRVEYKKSDRPPRRLDIVSIEI